MQDDGGEGARARRCVACRPGLWPPPCTTVSPLSLPLPPTGLPPLRRRLLAIVHIGELSSRPPIDRRPSMSSVESDSMARHGRPRRSSSPYPLSRRPRLSTSHLTSTHPSHRIGLCILRTVLLLLQLPAAAAVPLLLSTLIIIPSNTPLPFILISTSPFLGAGQGS